MRAVIASILAVSLAFPPLAMGAAAKTPIQPAAQPAHPIGYVPLHDCNLALHPLKDWLKAVSPAPEETDSYLESIENGEDALEQSDAKRGTLSKRYYILGNQIFEGMLMDFASGISAGAIADRVRQYVEPAMKALDDSMYSAREFHNLSKARGPRNEAAMQLALDGYVSASKRFGRAYSYFDMIMQTLESLAMKRGILDVKTIHEEENGNGSVMVYNLINDRIAKDAQKVLSILDKDSRRKFLPNAPVISYDGKNIPYPSLAVARFVFGNNVYARIENQKWKQSLQDYSSRPWVYVGQLLANIGNGIYGNKRLPPRVRDLLRTLSGLGDADYKATQYLGKLIDILAVTRFKDQSGNLVISSSDYLLNLQIDRLTEGQASGVADEMIETLVQVTLSRRVLDQLVLALAKKSSMQIKALPSKIIAAQKKLKAEQDAKKVPVGMPNLALESMVTPAAKASTDDASADISDEIQADNPQAEVESMIADVSPLSAGRLLLKIMEVLGRSDQLQPIPFAFPKTTALHTRFALVQLGWIVLDYEVYNHLSDIYNYLAHGVGTVYTDLITGAMAPFIQLFGSGAGGTVGAAVGGAALVGGGIKAVNLLKGKK